MSNAVTQEKDDETEADFVIRRTKEILGMAGFDWQQFSMEEKVMAAMNAQQEWDEKHEKR